LLLCLIALATAGLADLFRAVARAIAKRLS
jgi:hypothetical protein